jgi:esterase/lipase
MAAERRSRLLKLTLAGIALLVMLVAIFLAGPRVPIDTTIRAPHLPADLERHLAETESRVAGLRPGTEKLILWANLAERGRTPISIVYLHGYSASRQETRPLSERVARRLGANLFYTRLTGHGRDGAALAKVRVNDWLNDAVEALAIGRRLGEHVAVIGNSTGGTLATWLVTNGANDLLALVLLSPNFGVRDARAEILTLPWAHRLAPWIGGPEHGFEPVNARHARYWTTRYPTVALLPMMGLVQLVRTTPLDAVHVPVLTLYAPDDQIIDIEALRAVQGRFGSPRKSLIEIQGVEDPQQHVLAGDVLSPTTTDTVADHIVEFVGSAAAGTGPDAR